MKIIELYVKDLLRPLFLYTYAGCLADPENL